MCDVDSDIRVAVIDDDAMARAGISMIVSSAPGIEVVGQADDGSGAVDLVARHAPDVVLMDIQMPGMDGLQATAALAALARPPRIIMITSFNLDEHVFDALAAGATGFLLKEASPTEIVDAVRVVAAGEAMLSPQATTHLIGHYVTKRRDPQRRAAKTRLGLLTERECEVLTSVAEGRSNSEIAGALFLSEATVKTHLTRMFTKLDVSNRVQLAIFAHRSGLVDW
ncbi:response regulator [Microlunatus soli]|uniref:DNA-binding response regulator, NarL/FixJ family, contains REC and HTH domains n=1 Tax=Microlunatus soli TaxID=630515 RepID=A0A1H1WXC3_9ACTN|nr:response regulator transcription factor [Microlunatus soli]SDT01734.1 DNA-binding response regulator, NarL/FixJ family, contains REC and HTH domains [Microlunatus soli]